MRSSFLDCSNQSITPFHPAGAAAAPAADQGPVPEAAARVPYGKKVALACLAFVEYFTHTSKVSTINSKYSHIYQ